MYHSDDLISCGEWQFFWGFVTPKRPPLSDFRSTWTSGLAWTSFRFGGKSPGSFCWKPSVSGRHFGEVEAFGEDSPNGGRLARQQMKTTETGGLVVSDGSENQSHRSLLICKCSELWIIFPFLITKTCTEYCNELHGICSFNSKILWANLESIYMHQFSIHCMYIDFYEYILVL